MRKTYILILLCFQITAVLAMKYPSPTKPDINKNYSYAVRENTIKNQMIPEGIFPQNSESLRSSCEYTSNSQIAALDTSELVSFLRSSSDYNCHAKILFEYDQTYSPSIFTNEKIQAVAKKIKNIAPDYDGSYTNGIYGLLCYIHVATYFDFYHNPDVTLNQESWDLIIDAMNTLCENTHLFDLSYSAATILEEFIVDLDLPGVRSQAAVIAFVKKVMNHMVIDKTWKTVDDSKLVAGYWRIFFLMFRGTQDNDYIAAIKDDSEFFELWGKIATDTEIQESDDFSFWQDNSVLELARVATNKDLGDKILPILADVCNSSPRLSKNWLNAINAINDSGKCEEYNLCINKDDIQAELIEKLFPYTYSYNDGNLVFRAKFSQKEADNLYYASMQAKAQLFRLLQTDQPVDGDVNEKLTAIVFESKTEYDNYATYLYGITTDNGGMYLEQPAEFYTWDRPDTYSLSLEELFRHEFCHYLQGRYLIPGYWGQVPFYDNDRLTWYEEGNAELLCASTDNHGIRLKQSTVNTLLYDYPDCPSVSDILSSYYGQAGSIYYPYGNILWYYFYKKDYDKIKTLFDLTRNNDISKFDTFVNEMKNDETLEANWRIFLSDIKEGIIPAWQITTFWLPDSSYTIGNLEDIKSEFIDIVGNNNISIEKDALSSIQRFKISGSIGIKNTDNTLSIPQRLNQALDSLIGKLKADEYINNFDCLIGYISNILESGENSISEFHITGSLRNANVPNELIPDFKTDKTTVVAGASVSFQSISKGYIKGYEWTFEGGEPSTSNEVSPSVIYNTPGIYTVTLKITGPNIDDEATKTASSYITVYSAAENDYCVATHRYDPSWISHVKLADIDNFTSGFPTNGYANYTVNHVTELETETEYPITVDLNYTNSSTVNIGVWIDLNGNGSFEDEGETMFTSHIEQLEQLTGATVLIPNSAQEGTTRMRIRATYNGQILPCGEDNYMGEVEDYSVVIKKKNTTHTDYSTSENILFYPNPSSGTFYITGLKNIEQVKIYSLNGILLQTIEASSSASNDKMEINFKDVDRGTYIVSVYTTKDIKKALIIIK